MSESLLSLEDLLNAAGGVHLLGNGTFCFTSVSTDSRNLTEKSLFVPLIGETQDGHAYVPQALEKGASVVLIALGKYESNSDFFVSLSKKYPSVYFIGVQNTLHGLQAAAAGYVSKFPNLIKVSVTGSSGKTTTKEIALSLLSQKYNVVANVGNLNSETGLPLSVFTIRPEHELGLFEMGMNRKNEMKEIAGVLKPSFAIITNIGTAHIGILGSRENIAAEKSHVFDYFDGKGTAIIPKDDDFASYLQDKAGGHAVFYGDGFPSNVKFISDDGLEGTSFAIDGIPVHLSIPGKYNYKNALGAIALAQSLGLTTDEIVKGFKSIKTIFGRSEIIRGDVTVVQDCYNANPDSMEKAIEMLSCDTKSLHHFLVLGDMLELGDSSLESHTKVIRFAVESGAYVLLVGSEMHRAYEKLCADKTVSLENCSCFADKSDKSVDDAVALLKIKMHKNDAVLIKGSRGMALERISQKILKEAFNA